MTKKRERDQTPSAEPALPRRELLIRTGQVAFVVGGADVLATLVMACGDDAQTAGPYCTAPGANGVMYCYDAYGYHYAVGPGGQYGGYDDYGSGYGGYDEASGPGPDYDAYGYGMASARFSGPPRYQRGA